MLVVVCSCASKTICNKDAEGTWIELSMHWLSSKQATKICTIDPYLHNKLLWQLDNR